MAPTPPVIPRAGVATRAKNATQRPGLIDRESKQTRRGPAEMAKVRSTARLNTRLTDQRLHATLKNVAEIQDQQHVKDINASVPKMAPSLRRHEKQANEVLGDENALREAEAFTAKTLDTQQVDPMDEDLSVDEEDALPVPSKKRLAPDYYDYWNFGSDEDIATELPRKKKKGDGLRDVVVALRKNVPSENLELKMNLVTKVPPIPAPKGKRPRSLCVQFYVISK